MTNVSERLDELLLIFRTSLVHDVAASRVERRLQEARLEGARFRNEDGGGAEFRA